MLGVVDSDDIMGAGVVTLALLWIALFAPRIASSACARMRAALAQDIETTRTAPIDALMPCVLPVKAHRIAVVALSGVWCACFVLLWISVGVSSRQALAYSAFVAVLYLISLIDIETQLLPSSLVGAALWGGLVASTFLIVPLPIGDAIVGSVVGWLLYFLPNAVLSLTRPGSLPAVGSGDVALMAACGAWLGPQHVLMAGCMATVIAIVMKGVISIGGGGGPAYLPFGPLIGACATISLCINLYT